jgi:hypothetical protein
MSFKNKLILTLKQLPKMFLPVLRKLWKCIYLGNCKTALKPIHNEPEVSTKLSDCNVRQLPNYKIFLEKSLSIQKLISSSRAPFEKLIIAQWVSKYFAFCKIRSFFTVSTRTRHWTPPWATWIQTTSTDPVSLRFILIFSQSTLPTWFLSTTTVHLSSLPP